jgi:hypothetical protein
VIDIQVEIRKFIGTLDLFIGFIALAINMGK